MSVLVRKEVWRKSRGETQKLQWFLGKLSQDDAETILKDRGDRNTHVVYTHASNNAFVLAFRLPHDESVTHFDILRTNGRYKVSGQTHDYDDVIEAVHDFTARYTRASLKPILDSTADAGLQHHALESEQREDTSDMSTVTITCSFPSSPPPYQGTEKV